MRPIRPKLATMVPAPHILVCGSKSTASPAMKPQHTTMKTQITDNGQLENSKKHVFGSLP